MPDYVRVERSTNVSGFAYDAAAGELLIAFKSRLYRYFEVPAHVAKGLQAAAADGGGVGAWVHEHIVRGNPYAYERVAGVICHECATVVQEYAEGWANLCSSCESLRAEIEREAADAADRRME